MGLPDFVSVHGGHSGQFCNHATDMLEEIVQTYIAQEFLWVGISEHAPPLNERLSYRDQREQGLTPRFLFEQYELYVQECRRLQTAYKDEITIYTAIEIETYSGYDRFVPHLLDSFKPDYLVGSVHFVNDLNFDYSPSSYKEAAESVGGVDALYESYLDIQYEMIDLLQPSVVGHFDLVRIFDPAYRERMQKSFIWSKIERNLALIKKYDLILDLNLRALAKGADEPYIARPILELAREMDIKVVPGDDSHGILSVGNYMERGITLLEDCGFDTKWPIPALYGTAQR